MSRTPVISHIPVNDVILYNFIILSVIYNHIIRPTVLHFRWTQNISSTPPVIEISTLWWEIIITFFHLLLLFHDGYRLGVDIKLSSLLFQPLSASHPGGSHCHKLWLINEDFIWLILISYKVCWIYHYKVIWLIVLTWLRNSELLLCYDWLIGFDYSQLWVIGCNDFRRELNLWVMGFTHGTHLSTGHGLWVLIG